MTKNIHEVQVEIKGKDWEDALQKSFEKNVKDAKIDGFRKGKASKDVYIKKYGLESLFMDAIDFALPNAYIKVMEESKLLPIVQPDVDIKTIDDKHVELNFTITTKPEVKLGKYKNLGVKKPEVKVTKEEITQEVEGIKQKYAELVVKEGKVENGDVTIIDFEGFKDGVAFDGGKGENHSLEIGSNTFIPGFEESLIGKKLNDEFEFDIKFPEDYANEELKGQKVVFKIKVNEIKQRIIPELNKDLFEDLGLEGVNTKEDLEKVLEENITVRKQNDSENQYVDELLKTAAKNVEVEIPEALIHEEIHRMFHQYEEQLQMQGVTLEQFYKMTNMTQEQLEEQMKEEAKNRVLYRMMLEEIAIKEKIEMTNEQADKEAEQLAEKYQMPKEEFLKAFGGLEMIKYDFKMRKAIEILKNN